MKPMFCLALALALALVDTPAYSQGCSHASSPSQAEAERVIIAPTFYSSDPAKKAERGTVIEQLSPSDVSYVVRDDAVCGRLAQRAIRFMRAHDSIWASRGEGNYRANVFRFGPYLVVSISAEQPSGTYTRTSVELPEWRGHGYVIVYRANGAKYLRAFR